MKRISEKDFVKMNSLTWTVFSVLVILAVVSFFFLDLFPEPTYAELEEKNVVVADIIRVHIYRSGDVYRVCTVDGETYNLTGSFAYEDLKDILLPNTTATIKWARNRFVIFPDYAEEVIVNGQVVVRYNNDEPIPRSPYYFMAGLFAVFGALFLWGRLWWTKHLRTKQEKRDKRIQRKYGNNRKPACAPGSDD